MEFYLRYDLIKASDGPDTSALIETALEQVQWADKKGFTTVQLAEHHGTSCSYNPAPMILGAAIAARTETLKLQPILMLPFHDAVRLGEDLCVLDQLSKGRLEVALGLGYVPSEFRMFGLDPKARGTLADGKLAVLRDILNGQPFDFDGRQGQVSPRPYQAGGPPLYIGGGIKASARRAARYGDGFFPLSPQPELLAEYESACRELGKAPGRIIVGNVVETTIYVTDDPDRAWQQIAPYANNLHSYYLDASRVAGQDTGFADVANFDELRALNLYRVMTPDDAIALCREEFAKDRFIVLHPLIGGMPPELSWPALEMFADKVIPALQQL